MKEKLKMWQSKLTIKNAIPICAIILVAAGLYYFKSTFIAATVNGSPISRLSVMKELEKQGGKQALESLIDKKLIETELEKQNITVSQADVDSEIKKIEAQVTSQGGTLEMVLQQQGMTKEKLVEQITMQKKVEKLLADKIVVTDEEVAKYITSAKETAPTGMKAEDFKEEVRTQLKQQKLQTEGQNWVSGLMTNAKINYYVNY